MRDLLVHVSVFCKCHVRDFQQTALLTLPTTVHAVQLNLTKLPSMLLLNYILHTL